MAGNNKFRSLRNGSAKFYKFKQGRSNLPDSEGECVPLCLMWIKEMLIMGSPHNAGGFLPAFTDNVMSHNRQHEYNRFLSEAASKFPRADEEQDIQVLEQYARLTARASLIRPASGEQRIQELLLQVHDQLPVGAGVLVQVDLHIPPEYEGHGIALFRIGVAVMAFDPNCGIYTIGDPGIFFHNWAQCYRNMGVEDIQPWGDPPDPTEWCRVYTI